MALRNFRMRTQYINRMGCNDRQRKEAKTLTLNRTFFASQLH